mgnify:CR=1 FL=1
MAEIGRDGMRHQSTVDKAGGAEADATHARKGDVRNFAKTVPPPPGAYTVEVD